MNKKVFYDQKLAEEWSEWVEMDNASGGREKEIYPLIREWLKKVRPCKVVDIGCGQGVCSTLVGSRVKYIGIDQSEFLIERAREHYSNNNATFKVGDADDIPLKDNSTDSILSLWVWSHLPELQKGAREMCRILQPNGHFLVITANPSTYNIRKTFYSTYKDYDGYLIGTFDLGGGKTLTDTNLYFHTETDMKNALLDAGLAIDEVKTFGLEDEYPGGLNIMITGRKVE